MRAASCETVVLGQQEVAENIMKMRVSWVDEEHAPHAGQFFMLRGWADDEAPFLSRPISLHSFDAQQESLEFLYQVKGEGTEKLSQLEEGDVIRVTGPMGNGFDVQALTAANKKIAVVGGGIGACLGCTCHTAGGAKSVCKNGPVFDAAEIYGGEVQA